MIIRKSDGGYNYSSTDLATIRYRVDTVKCDRAIYVVGSDQALHFRMVFAVAREAGWLPGRDDFEHAQIGMVQGKDGHRLRTRAGDNVKLSDLLSEGVERARAILDEVERDTDRPETGVSTWTPSRRTSASARSSTPTCRPRGTAPTSSTGTG